ncbi:hypothetical protein ABK040_012197 [Willaertia magna]
MPQVELFKNSAYSERKGLLSNVNVIVNYLENEEDIFLFIDKWFTISNNLNKNIIFYLDTEIANYNIKHLENISIIQCLPILLLENENNRNECTIIDSLQSLENNYLHNKEDNIFKTLENILFKNEIFIFDVLQNENCKNYFIEKIMKNENIVKVFHFAVFDISYLGGFTNCKNILCTYEIVKKFIPFHILQIDCFKLNKLVEYFISYNRHEVVNNNFDSLIDILTCDNKLEMQQSDWAVRPLSLQQLEYSCKDVIGLIFLHLNEMKILCDNQNIYYKNKYFTHLKTLQYNNLFYKDEVNQPTTVNNQKENEEDIDQLDRELKEISNEFKILESKYNNLNERLKKVMLTKEMKETKHFKLISSKRNFTSIPLLDLVESVIELQNNNNTSVDNLKKTNLNDIKINVTKEMRKIFDENGLNDVVNYEKYMHQSTLHYLQNKK